MLAYNNVLYNLMSYFARSKFIFSGMSCLINDKENKIDNVLLATTQIRLIYMKL